jgi:hypothetical protein
VVNRRETVTQPTARFNMQEWERTNESFTPGVYEPAPPFSGRDTYTFDTDGLQNPDDTGLDTAGDTDAVIDTDPATTGVLLLSEIADPVDFEARFIELYNAGDDAINLRGWGVQLYSNGGTQPETHPLPAFRLAAGQTWVVAFSNPGFLAGWGFAPDDPWNAITGSGDDVYTLVQDVAGAWIVIDVYGEIGTDGEGTDWEYTDQTAWRHPDVTSPTDVFQRTQWTITADPLQFTPDAHPPAP